MSQLGKNDNYCCIAQSEQLYASNVIKIQLHLQTATLISFSDGQSVKKAEQWAKQLNTGTGTTEEWLQLISQGVHFHSKTQGQEVTIEDEHEQVWGVGQLSCTCTQQSAD